MLLPPVTLILPAADASISSAVPVLAASNPLEHVLPHKIFEIGGFAVTNHLFMATFAAVLTFLTLFWVSRRIRVTESSIQGHMTKGVIAQLIEVMCLFIYENVAKPNLKHLTDKYIPFIWTIFFFVLFCNVLGMIPFGYIGQFIAGIAGAENPKYFGHWGGTASSNLSLNVPLALCSFIAVVYIGIKEVGVKHFFAHFNPLGWDAESPLMFVMGLMMWVLEVVGLVIKCAVLALRLFGTMLAGHLVLAALVGMIIIFGNMNAILGHGVGIGVVVLNTLLSVLELFIAFLQAFIFTFLTTLFIAMTAVSEHDHDHGHDEAHDHDSHAEPAAVAAAST